MVRKKRSKVAAADGEAAGTDAAATGTKVVYAVGEARSYDLGRVLKEVRRGANEKRREKAQPTPEQREAIAAYFGRRPSGYGAVKHFMTKFGWSESTARRMLNRAKATSGQA
jgi:hypothetical protein